MKLLLIVALSSSLPLIANESTGIKTSNLRGADLDLMNNHDPNSELENFELLPGYQANLFAADPMLANPVHMTWDSQGRLWVACSWAYPQLEPGDVANDKIIILEDTDNDGQADKSTVFAEGLYVPTGIELANGGCYVGQSPDVFFLKDTNGDDVADIKQLALTGFGIEDSHHSVSAWRRGPGGWIYFQEGIFLHSQIETPYGVLRNFNGGVYQLNPRTQELKMFCTGTGGNPWGHVFDRWGQSFMVNNPKIMHLSPTTGNSGEQTQVKPLISTEKQCGGDLATGSHVGDDIRGQLLTGRFKSRAVIRYEFIENGAGFSANVLKPLISSKHPNFRPVDVKTGPDGAIYVADWYNSIINHAQHDFRDPRRDHDHGRIWRITHKERPLVKKPTLVGTSIESLVTHLKSPEYWTRHQAKKELSESDPIQVLAAVEKWVDSLDPSLPEYDHHLVEAMWACQNVEKCSEKILTLVINAKNGRARSAGARIIRYWHQDLSDPVPMIAKLANDPFPRTRMEAVLSAGFIPKAEAWLAALNSLDHPTDQVLALALPQTTKALEAYWKPAMAAGTLKFAKESHRVYAERKTGAGLPERLRKFLALPSPSAQEIAEIQTELVAVGSSQEIRMVLNSLKESSTKSPLVLNGLLDCLQKMQRHHNSKSNRRALAGVGRLLQHKDESVIRKTAETLGLWKITQSGPNLVTLLKDETRSLQTRETVGIALARLGKTRFVEPLKELNQLGDIPTRYATIPGLTLAELEASIESLVVLMKEDPGDVDPVPAVQSIMKSRRGGRLLSAALEGAPLHPTVVARVAQFHRKSGQLPQAVAGFFREQSNTGESLSSKLLAEDPQKLTADVVKQGDPHRGEMIYRRSEMACSNCHAIGSVGSPVGPNLAAVGAAASPSYMVESILKPNAAIAEHYENKLIALKDGTVQMGVITFRSEHEVVLRDSAQQGGQEVRIPASDIQKEQTMPSLMPAGLADQLQDRQEFLDLCNFLSVLGRPGQFSNNERPFIRKWQISSTNDATATWKTVYSKVDGELPSSDMGSESKVFARGFLNVQVAGAASLEINEPGSGLELWIDEQKIDDLSQPIELEKGRRTFTFAIDRSTRKPNHGLLVEINTPSGSLLKFQPEGGL